METNINYTLVGAFVIFLTTAAILAIIWLSTGFTPDTDKKYLVYMQESVSGLTVDSAVEYNGVDVGTVKDIRISAQNPQTVILLLSIRQDTPITRGTVATLNTRGLTGMTFVSLKDKSTDLRPLVKLKGQQYPVIKTVPSFFLRLDIALSQFSTNFRKISESIQALLDKENLREIKLTLANLERLSANLAISSHKLDAILANTSVASRQLSPFLQAGRSTMRTIETQTLPAAYNLLSNMSSIAETLDEVTEELQENPSVLIRGKSVGQLGPGESEHDTNKHVELGPGEFNE